MDNTNEYIAKVFVSHPSKTLKFKKEDLKEGSKSLVLNDFLKKDEEVKFGDIKECFLYFNNLGITSSLFDKGGFLEHLKGEGAKYAKNKGIMFYNSEKNYNAIVDFLKEGEEIVVVPLKKLCISNITINATKEVNEKLTFCGYISKINETAKMEVSIGANLENLSGCEDEGFYDLIFKEFYDTFNYNDEDDRPDKFTKKSKSQNFLFCVNFQSFDENAECGCNHWITFNAKITSANIVKDASNSISEFSPVLAVDGSGMAHQKNCKRMQIFGDEILEEDKGDPDIEEETEEDKKVKAFVSEAQDYLNRAYNQLREGILSKADYTEEIAELSMGINELKPVAEKMLKKEIRKRADIEVQLFNKAFEIKELNKDNKFAKEFIKKALDKLCTWFCTDDPLMNNKNYKNRINK